MGCMIPISILCLACAVGFGLIVYMILYVKVTGTTAEQLRKFPMGSYMVKALRMIKVLR